MRAAPFGRPRHLRGQAAVEMAILASALVLLLGTAIGMGRLGYLAMTLDDSARAGAQYGSQSYTTDGDITGMKNAATNDATNINGATWWGSRPPSVSALRISADAATGRWSLAPVPVRPDRPQSTCRSRRRRITFRCCRFQDCLRVLPCTARRPCGCNEDASMAHAPVSGGTRTCSGDALPLSPRHRWPSALRRN